LDIVTPEVECYFRTEQTKMWRKIIFAIIITTLFLSCHNEEPSEPPYGSNSVVVVTNRDYTPFVLEAINKSENYIHILMYEMKYYAFDSVCGESQLLNALIQVHTRGVEVKVILERSNYNSNLNEINESTYVYLVSEGINVRFDSPSVTTHAKLVVIDDKVAFLGSTNWTKSALDGNNEVNVEVTEEGIVRELELYFQNLWSQSSIYSENIINNVSKDGKVSFLQVRNFH